ncbi:MAG: flagellar hook-length control protein FliK [Planctomycetota bacterium]
MSAINIDILTRLTAIDPKYADNAPANTANSQSAFGDYLQRAQTQPANALWGSRGRSNAPSSDSATDRTRTTADAKPQTTNATEDRPVVRSDDRESRKTRDDSSPRRPDATPDASSQHDSSPPTSTNKDAPTTSQEHRNEGSRDSGSESSNQDPAHPSDTSQEDDAHKIAKGDVAAVIVDINALALAPAAASAAPIAGGNPSNDVQVQAATAPAGTKLGNALSLPVAVNMPQAIPAAAANANSQTAPAQTATAQTATAQTTAAQVPVAQTTAVSPTDPALPKEPAAVTAATTVDPSATTPSAKTDEKTAGQASTADINSIAAAAAVMPVNPAANAAATPPTDLKSPPTSPLQSTAVSGVHAASAGQAANTANTADAASATAAPANDEIPTAPDVQSARDQRAKATADALSQSGSGNDTNKTTTQPGDSTSGQTAAAPQTAAHSTTGASGGLGTTHAAETNIGQADRVRFVQRVEQAFQDLNGQGGSVRMRLSPPELGSLHIEITVVKGEMTARVEAETPAARNILLENLPALRERLAQHDIKVQRFEVDLMDRSTGGMSNQSSQYQNPSQQNPDSTFVRTPFRGNNELSGTVEKTSSRPASDGGRLNVVV